MSKTTTSRRLWVSIGLVLIVLATAGKAVLNAAFEDFKGRGEREAETVREARSRGILVTELSVDPPQLEGAGVRVWFHEAWIEERSLPSHFLVWIPTEKRRGGYRLHFTFARVEGAHEVDVSLRPVDAHLHPHSVSGGGKTLHCIPLDDPHISEVRCDVTRAYRGPHIGSVRFVPKPKS